MSLTFCTYGQRKKAIKEENRLSGVEVELQKVLTDWHGAGFAVAVIQKDKLIYSQGFGVKDINTKEPVTDQTLFAIGSCTKAFTSSLLGMLVAEDKVDLDVPARTYLPSLEFYNNDMNNMITLRDMMCHRTGLPRHDLSWYLNQSKDREVLLKRIKYQEPTYRPKEKWQYNNFMFLAQGMVTEKITGKSWETNIQDKIFTPLGMDRSNISYGMVKDDKNLASPHAFRNDSTLRIVPHYNIEGMAPAGAIYSSVSEMSRWVQTWIYGGKFGDKRIFSESYAKEAISAQMNSGAGLPDKDHPDIHGSSYGFGWFLSSYRGHYRVEHGGAIDGFIATTCFYPSDSIGIVVLSNQSSRQIPSIIRNIVSDRMLGLTKQEWNKEFLAISAKAKVEAADAKTKSMDSQKHDAKMSHKINDYAGIFENPGYGKMEVYMQNDSLFIKTDHRNFYLQHRHYDIFYPKLVELAEKIDTVETGGMTLRFNTGVNGEFTSFNAYGMEAPTISLEFKYVPKPKDLSKEELERYIGTYSLGGMDANVYIKNELTLIVELPNQPAYELIPIGNDKFAFKSLDGFYIQFDAEKDKPATALTFMQPNGNFKAIKK